MKHQFEGKHVIVRADKAGVFFGILKEKEGSTVTLENVRKLFYWDGACAVEQIAVDGVKKQDDCKFTVVVPIMEIENTVQTIPCSTEAVKNLSSVPVWSK